MKQGGFTLIEIIVIWGIVATLIGIGLIGTLAFRSSSTLSASGLTLAGDLRSSQMKAMVADTEGRGAPDAYGIFFAPVSYTLFHGTTYSPIDTSNFIVPIGDNLAIATTLAGNQLVFATASGEPITSISPGSDTVTIRDTTTTSQFTITLNRYGVIISQQLGQLL